MDWLTLATWATPIGAGLVGLVCGDLWRRKRWLAEYQAALDTAAAAREDMQAQRLRVGTLENELRAQSEQAFSLEAELEARDNDWALSSASLISFDAHTFQIDRSERLLGAEAPLRLELAPAGGTQERRQRSPIDRRARPSTAAQSTAPLVVPEAGTHGGASAPGWTELDAANSAHGALYTAPDDARLPPPSLVSREPFVEIEGLSRRIDSIRSGVADTRVDQADGDPPQADPPTDADDLTLVEGIGASCAKALNDAGFRRFQDLAAATPEQLGWALAAAGPMFAQVPTASWPEQAALLADRRIAVFRKLTSQLQAGARRASS